MLTHLKKPGISPQRHRNFRFNVKQNLSNSFRVLCPTGRLRILQPVVKRSFSEGTLTNLRRTTAELVPGIEDRIPVTD